MTRCSASAPRRSPVGTSARSANRSQSWRTSDSSRARPSDIRAHRLAPLFKLYLINGSEAFFGFYPVTERAVTIADVEHRVFDLMGKDAVLFHYAVGDDLTAIEAQFVRQGTLWFDSVWESVARPARP